MSIRNIESIRINQLRVITSLFKTKNVTDTAVEMSLTQSAISKILATLRNAFNDEIFIKTRTGMEPTSFGHAVLAEIEDILVSAQRIDALSNRFDPATTKETITIACNDFFQNALLMRTMRIVRKQAPYLNIRFSPLQPHYSIDQLSSGEVSLLIAEIDQQSENIISELFCQEQLILVIPKSHELATKKSLTLKDVASSVHVQVASELKTNKELMNILKESGEQLICPLTLSSFGPLAPLLSAGEHVAILPEKYIDIYGQLFPIIGRPLPFNISPVSMQINWHRRNKSDPLVNWILNEIRRTFS